MGQAHEMGVNGTDTRRPTQGAAAHLACPDPAPEPPPHPHTATAMHARTRPPAPAHCGRLNQRSRGVSRMEESSSRNSSALNCGRRRQRGSRRRHEERS